MMRNAYGDRTYSLPRTSMGGGHFQQQAGYYTQDRRPRNGTNGQQQSGGNDTPDFYFMPSQRKYSGEVVRVYVDYNKEPKN